MSDQRKEWFARVVESGLKNEIFNPADVLAHDRCKPLCGKAAISLATLRLATFLAHSPTGEYTMGG